MDFDLGYFLAGLRAPGLSPRYVPETGSTNDDLLAEASLPEGAVLIAGRQSAGRGRMGRGFASPEGGLYMSVLLRPEPAAAEHITARAAVAAALAIEGVSGRKTGIKWVNDILIDGKKACGILASARAGDGLAVALGFGVNVSAVPEGLEDTACAVFADPPGRAREALAAAILNAYFLGAQDVFEEYARRCVSLGRAVTVRSPAGEYPARAVALDRGFRLVVERGDGSRTALDSGEASVKI